MRQIREHYPVIGEIFVMVLLLLFIFSHAAAAENNSTINGTNSTEIKNITNTTFAGTTSVNDTPISKGSAAANTVPANGAKSTDSLPELVKYVSLLFVAIGIIITGFVGIKLFFNNYEPFLKPSKLDKDELKQRSIAMILGIVMVLSCIYVLLYVIKIQVGQVVITRDTTSAFSIIIPVFLCLLVFGAVLLMCIVHSNMKELEVGSMRKTIASLLVVGLLVVVFFALFGKILNDGIITQYIQLVSVVIAFYFGSRVAGDAAEKAAEAEGKRVAAKEEVEGKRVAAKEEAEGKRVAAEEEAEEKRISRRSRR